MNYYEYIYSSSFLMLSAKIGRHICKFLNIQQNMTNTITTGAIAIVLCAMCIMAVIMLFLNTIFTNTRYHYNNSNKLLLIIFRDYRKNQIHSIACIPYKSIQNIRDQIDADEYVKYISAHTKNYQYKNSALFLYAHEKITCIQSLISFILKNNTKHKIIKIYIYDNVGIDINFISDIIYYSVGKIKLCTNSKIIDQQQIYLTVSEDKKIKFINVNYLIEASIEEMLTRYHMYDEQFNTIYSSLQQKHIDNGIFNNIITYSVYIAYILVQYNILIS